MKISHVFIELDCLTSQGSGDSNSFLIERLKRFLKQYEHKTTCSKLFPKIPGENKAKT